MTVNANGQKMKLYTELGAFDSEVEYDRARWNQAVRVERQRQIEKGYNAEHDDAQGLDHLLAWAIEYIRVGKPVEAAALVQAAREKLTRDAAPAVQEGPEQP